MHSKPVKSGMMRKPKRHTEHSVVNIQAHDYVQWTVQLSAEETASSSKPRKLKKNRERNDDNNGSDVSVPPPVHSAIESSKRGDTQIKLPNTRSTAKHATGLNARSKYLSGR